MSSRPLLVTADADLLDELLRLCAAAGAEAQVAHDISAARLCWTATPLVLIGVDQARAASAGRLPKRTGVVLVGLDRDDDSAWELARDVGADSVGILPGSEPWLIDRLGQASDAATGSGLVIAVVGGRGGAGATTLATALALSGVERDLRCLLVDADPLGGGIDLVVGGEECTGLRWPDLAAAGGRVSGSVLREALPHVHGLSVLSAARGDPLGVSPAAMRSVLAAGARMSDLVVVDLPRYVDAAAEHALAAAAVTLIVVPAEVRAAAAANRVAVRVGLTARDIRVVVRGPSPAGLTAADVAQSLGLPLAGWLPPEPGLDEALERGVPPGRGGRSPLASFCRDLLDDLGAARRLAA